MLHSTLRISRSTSKQLSRMWKWTFDSLELPQRPSYLHRRCTDFHPNITLRLSSDYVQTMSTSKSTRLDDQHNAIEVVVTINSPDLIGDASNPQLEEVNTILVTSPSILTSLILVSPTIYQSTSQVLLIFQPQKLFKAKLPNVLHHNHKSLDNRCFKAFCDSNLALTCNK